jgi:DNA-binding NarL/FixJ family response regulator
MIRLYFLDNHPLILEGLHSILSIEHDISLVGQSRTGAGCLNFLLCNSVDIILMDTCLPDINSQELCANIRIAYPTVSILILSSMKEVHYIAELLRSGASGYVLNNADKDELLLAIHTVYEGEIYLSPDIREAIKTQQQNSRRHLPPLTRREKEVLFLIAEGNTNTEIAEMLFISADTVNSHRKKLLSKLEVKNTAMLIKYAVDHKLLV